MNGIRRSPAALIVSSRTRRTLRRRALVRDQVRIDRLEHQALGRGHLAQPGEIAATQHPEVGVRQHPALERLLADPDDVGDEILEAEFLELRADAGVDLGPLAGEYEQLLDRWRLTAPSRMPQHFLGLVQVRLMGRERAVLAVAAARPRQRQREIAGEGDATAHANQNVRDVISGPVA